MSSSDIVQSKCSHLSFPLLLSGPGLTALFSSCLHTVGLGTRARVSDADITVQAWKHVLACSAWHFKVQWQRQQSSSISHTYSFSILTKKLCKKHFLAQLSKTHTNIYVMKAPTNNIFPCQQAFLRLHPEIQYIHVRPGKNSKIDFRI